MTDLVAKTINLADGQALSFCLDCGGGFTASSGECLECRRPLTSRSEIEERLTRSAPGAKLEELRAAALVSFCAVGAGKDEEKIRALLGDAEAPHLSIERWETVVAGGAEAQRSVEFLVTEEDLDFLSRELAALEKLVLVAVFPFQHDAELAQATLAAEGIWSTTLDAETIRMNWLLSNALGRVKLMVRVDDFDAAKRLLEPILERDSEGQARLSYDPCPACGGRRTAPVELGKRWAYFTWLLVTVPLIPIRRRWRCEDCGHVWK